MSSIRSLLWIGGIDALHTCGLHEAPRLDVTWACDADEALTLDPTNFEVAVLAESCDRVRAALALLRRRPQFPPLFVCLEADQTERAGELLGAGAADILIASRGARERVVDDLIDRLDRLSKSRRSPFGRALPAARAGAELLPGVIGSSRPMQDLAALVERAHTSSATVLLTGETGTGKERVAQALHEMGPRSARPFVPINCAAFPETLLESELFGHARGAFTGAERDKKGLFETASGGTLFLDEIGETSAALQAKLLRALQEREIRPVGSTRSLRVDVRVIAATNRSLREESLAGRFREDLFYRLAVFPLRVPPLRERPEDIVQLAQHFLARYGERDGKPGCRLAHASAHLLVSYKWPGNVRELENEMQRSLALAEAGEVISPGLLSERVLSLKDPLEAAARPGDTLRDSMARVESWLIRRSLERNEGHKTATARQLGVTREGLYKKMKRLGIE